MDVTETPLPTRPVRIWDLPTRVFHWLTASLVALQIVTAGIAGNAMAWHLRFGYAILALLIFRVVWGFVGGRWSRFASFLYAPATVRRYLRGQHRPGEWLEVGHNPLGSGSVFAMLLLIGLQVGAGLLADDEIATTGPLNRFVSNQVASLATRLHTGPIKWLLFGLIALHVAVIVHHRVFRRDDLVRPMITGDKLLASDVPASNDSLATRLRALAVVVACSALVAWMVSLGG
jgi:cytochrome b